MTANWAAASALRIAVGIAVPTVSCLGYYALVDDGEAAGARAVGVVLAYPLALIGLIGLAALALAGKRSKPLYWAAGLCFALPAAFLLYIHR